MRSGGEQNLAQDLQVEAETLRKQVQLLSAQLKWMSLMAHQSLEERETSRKKRERIHNKLVHAQQKHLQEKEKRLSIESKAACTQRDLNFMKTLVGVISAEPRCRDAI